MVDFQFLWLSTWLGWWCVYACCKPKPYPWYSTVTRPGKLPLLSRLLANIRYMKDTHSQNSPHHPPSFNITTTHLTSATSFLEHPYLMSLLQPNSPILALFLIHIMHERKFLVLPANPFQAVGELTSVLSVGLYPFDQSMSSSLELTSSYTHTQ